MKVSNSRSFLSLRNTIMISSSELAEPYHPGIKKLASFLTHQRMHANFDLSLVSRAGLSAAG